MMLQIIVVDWQRKYIIHVQILSMVADPLCIKNIIFIVIIHLDRQPKSIIYFLVKDPHAPPGLPRGSTTGVVMVIFFITDTYLTIFVSIFFHLTNMQQHSLVTFVV